MASFFDNFSYSASDRSYSSVKNLGRLSFNVQRHLLKVYETLAASLFICAVGAYLHILLNFGGLLTALGFCVSAIWLMATPSSPSYTSKRLKLLAAAAFFQGASIGPLVELVVELDPRVLVTAFLGTACIFGCFSGAAILARRRELLFLGGFLSSAISVFFWMQLAASFFGGSTLYYNIELYGGLLLFIGYVLFDTQMIIERADRGDYDYVKHSLDLFVDIISIFVRLLVILLKNSSEKSGRDRKERRKRSF